MPIVCWSLFCNLKPICFWLPSTKSGWLYLRLRVKTLTFRLVHSLLAKAHSNLPAKPFGRPVGLLKWCQENLPSGLFSILNCSGVCFREPNQPILRWSYLLLRNEAKKERYHINFINAHWKTTTSWSKTFFVVMYITYVTVAKWKFYFTRKTVYLNCSQ